MKHYNVFRQILTLQASGYIFQHIHDSYQEPTTYDAQRMKRAPLRLADTQAQISPRVCAGRPGPSLSAYIITEYLSICRRTATVHTRLHEFAC